MLARARAMAHNLSQTLGFIPGLIVIVFAGLGIGLVEFDRSLNLDEVRYVFAGDGAAARTVLSVIAGSLITVAGLTFSITIVVLQLASSQFSPRTLKTLFGDRITQVTIATYVGTFVYSLLVLRAVGSFGDAGFVPRLSVTLASLLGIGAVMLLIVFLHHVSQLIQVSHVTASITRDTLTRVQSLYPEAYGESVEDADELLESWREQEAGQVLPSRPGFVQWIGADALDGELDGDPERVAVLVRPGDFVSVEVPIAEVWPPGAVEACREQLLTSVAIGDERDLDQDVGFGIRQLADTAIKAMSPGINDPATAVTCIGYLRSILVRLTEHAAPSAVRRSEESDRVVIFRPRDFTDHLDALLQIGRYSAADGWVVGELLRALDSCVEVARRCGADDRLEALRGVAATIVEQALAESKNDRDHAMVVRLAERLDVSVAPSS